jgi:hypothetical protein
MGTKHSGAWPTDNEPSWTDETLPLEERRKLLDHALDRIKAHKGLPAGHPGNQNSPYHPGESGSESSGRND